MPIIKKILEHLFLSNEEEEGVMLEEYMEQLPL
jgi:hypothetical protein